MVECILQCLYNRKFVLMVLHSNLFFKVSIVGLLHQGFYSRRCFARVTRQNVFFKCSMEGLGRNRKGSEVFYGGTYLSHVVL